MSSFLPKTTHVKESGNSQTDWKKIVNAKTMKKEVLELSDKDFRAVILKMLQWATTNMLETSGKIESLSKETGNLSKEREDTNKDPMDIFQLKTENKWN